MTDEPTQIRTRILNLDSFLPPTLTIVYQGQHHSVLPVNSEIWLRMLQQNESLIRQIQDSKKKKLDVSDQLDGLTRQQQEMLGTINMLCEVCPTLSRDELMKMPLIPLQKFSEAVMAMMEQEMEDAAGQQPGELTSSLSLVK